MGGAGYSRIYGNTGEAIFAAVLTLAILIFTEIIPKTIGATFAQQLAAPASVALVFMIAVLKPVVWCSQQIIRVLTPRGKALPSVHREELLAIARMGEASRSLGARKPVRAKPDPTPHDEGRDIMTPRPVIFALPEDTPLTDYVKLIEEKPFTRAPVYRGNPDEMTGFVIRGEVLLAHLKDDEDRAILADVARPLAATPEHTPVDILFQRFISERHQIMLVADEFGTTIGLVTFEDIIETIFGFEIMDEKDKVADMQLHARNLWHARARRMGIDLSETQDHAT